MEDSSINSIFLSSAAYLENVEQLIKNLHKNTPDVDNFEDILNERHRRDITKSFTSVSSSTMAIDDTECDDTFLVKSISLTNNPAINDEHLSMDSVLNNRDLFASTDLKKPRTPSTNEQSLLNEEETAFTWDDQYDTRANYRLTFSTDKNQQDPKLDRSHRHKKHHHHHHHRHHHSQKHKTNEAQSNSIYSDESLSPNTTNQVYDWSMRSSVNSFEQLQEQNDSKSRVAPTNNQQSGVIRSQSHPSAISGQQQLPNNNNSPNSSTSSSSSMSWKRTKDGQPTTSATETREVRQPSPMNLYKIFQQKSQANASSPRSAFQYYHPQTDSIVPNNNDSMTISGEKILNEKSKSTFSQKPQIQNGNRARSQATPGTDQAIQTSILLDSSSNNHLRSSSEHKSASPANQHLAAPIRSSSVASNSGSSIHKSLPDLDFISQYTKEIPRSLTASPSSSLRSNTTQIVSNQTIAQQQKQDADRPRTLKSIKRYKNNKHSTEPLGVFFSPQLGKTFAAVPASAIVNGTNDAPTIIKMKLPPPSSYPINRQQQQQQQASTLKSCLKYGSRANSCDIQAILQDTKPSAPFPQSINNKDLSSSPSNKRRCSETDAPLNHPQKLWPSDDSDNCGLQEHAREHRSDYDLTACQSNIQTKKSVSFSENIAKHLISPCNPIIKFDPAPNVLNSDDDNDDLTVNKELAMALHGNKENLTKKSTLRYGEMRRCQTDIIVVDRVHHLHSFTESPPNEFRLQDTDSLAPEQDDEDDQTIMEKMPINIIPNSDEPKPIVNIDNQSDSSVAKMTTSNDKENNISDQAVLMNVSTKSLIITNDPILDGLLDIVTDVVKRIFEIKRSQKTFFLVNENNLQLDVLLKMNFCQVLQNILEHGLKPQRKDIPLPKQVNIWKIIETTMVYGQTPQVFIDAKQSAANASLYWLYQFQAFIFALLNKNELINWLYNYVKQNDVLQRYYQSPDALVLLSNPNTFNLFDRIMAQLEKLSPLPFRLVYKADHIPSNIAEQLQLPNTNETQTKHGTRDWVATISRRGSRNLTQPIVSTASPAPATTQPTDTIRSTLSRKLTSFFNKNPTPTTPTPTQQKKTSSAVTTRLPSSKPPLTSLTTRTASPAKVETPRRPRLSNVFSNATAAATSNKPIIVGSPKLNQTNRTGPIRRALSPSVIVAPSPPPTVNIPTAAPAPTTFQSKIPRASLNVDKPKSARYKSAALPPK